MATPTQRRATFTPALPLACDGHRGLRIAFNHQAAFGTATDRQVPVRASIEAAAAQGGDGGRSVCVCVCGRGGGGGFRSQAPMGRGCSRLPGRPAGGRLAIQAQEALSEPRRRRRLSATAMVLTVARSASLGGRRSGIGTLAGRWPAASGPPSPWATSDPAAGDCQWHGARAAAPDFDSNPVMPRRPYPARGKAGVMRSHCALASPCDGRPYAGVGVGPINDIAFRANAISPGFYEPCFQSKCDLTGVLRAASPPAELSLQRPRKARMGSDRSKIWHPHFSLHPIGSGGA